MAAKFQDYLKEMQVSNKGSDLEAKGSDKGEILLTNLMTAHNQFKIFHWQTKSFAQHESYGEIYESLGKNMDDFIESYMGRYQRIYASSGKFVLNLDNYSGSPMLFVDKFISFLQDELPTYVGTKDTDLLNIRDTILGDVQQLRYLLTFP
jgi:hypothetical protein